MELEHYSGKPFTLEPRAYDQQPSQLRGVGKPAGLWVSVKGEDDWPSWCKAERFGEDRLLFRQRVDIGSANVLLLDTVAKMHAFNQTYAGGVASDTPPDIVGILGRLNKDWERVAAEYDGIIIAPYHWSLRMANDFGWYYGWDCASGCLWNLSNVTLGPAEVVEDLFVED